MTALLSLLTLLGGLAIVARFGKAALSRFSEVDLFSPLVAYPLAYTFWFVVGSIDFLELSHSTSFGAFDPIPGRVLAIAGVGLIGYLTGARSSLSTVRANNSEQRLQIRTQWQPRVVDLALLTLALTVAATYTYLIAHMGVPILSSRAGEVRLEINKYHWASTLFMASGYTLGLLLLARLWTRQRDRKGSDLAITTGVLMLVLLLASLGGRSYFVPLVVTTIVFYHYACAPVRPKALMVFLGVIFVILSLFGYLRDLTVSNGMADIVEGAGLPRQLLPFVYGYLYIRYPVATFRDITEVIPAQTPYQLGVLSTAPFRTLLPGHHDMSDMFFKNLLGNEFVGGGQPGTVLGPFYGDFGVLGVFVGMFLWGWLVAKLYKWMRVKRSMLSVLIYAWTTQAGLFGLFGGMFGYIDTLLIPLSWVVLDLLMSDGLAEQRPPAATVKFAR
jgi:oligosaccharide repeat unit polymerase